MWEGVGRIRPSLESKIKSNMYKTKWKIEKWDDGWTSQRRFDVRKNQLFSKRNYSYCIVYIHRDYIFAFGFGQHSHKIWQIAQIFQYSLLNCVFYRTTYDCYYDYYYCYNAAMEIFSWTFSVWFRVALGSLTFWVLSVTHWRAD